LNLTGIVRILGHVENSRSLSVNRRIVPPVLLLLWLALLEQVTQVNRRGVGAGDVVRQGE
jgi:hypothetical protein